MGPSVMRCAMSTSSSSAAKLCCHLIEAQGTVAGVFVAAQALERDAVAATAAAEGLALQHASADQEALVAPADAAAAGALDATARTMVC